MAELLLELLSEEIPARMQQPIAAQLKQAMEARLHEEKLFNTGVETYVTPRRLVLSVGGLSLTQEDTVSERKGPRTDAPEKAIEGFLKSTGLTLNQLTKRQTDKGEFYFAIQEHKGQPTKKVLVESLHEILPNLAWPKSMRWGSHQIRWVRPLKRILCVFGGEILPITYGPIEASDVSEGHRFLSPDTFPANDFASFQKNLESRHVILSTEQRKQRILEQAQALIIPHNLSLVEDDGLLNEVAGLVEWPEVLLGSIDQTFMDLPEEVLISSIRTHQKYFCTRSKEGKLAPYFLVVSNMKTNDQGKKIIAGNERVLRARLSDANFFWNQDLAKPLEDRLNQLAHVIYHAKLGSIADKATRVQALAQHIAIWVPHANLTEVARSAELCKADLVTEMVGDFPELQGFMGAYYAKAQGESNTVSQAIEQHYSPLGPHDTCPGDPTAVTLAIADKIDTLVGLFAANEKPTGSKDPYALRRAALGVIRLILENQLRVPLRLLFEKSLKQFPKAVFAQREEDSKPKKITPQEVVQQLLTFFEDRLKHIMKAENLRHDLIAAILSHGEDDLLRALARVVALQQFLDTDDGVNLLAAYRRASNIVVKETRKDKKPLKGNPNKNQLEQEEEQHLSEAIENMKSPLKKALKEDRFEDAMHQLASLRAPLDQFFDHVMVNDENAQKRLNRLKLLTQIIAQFEQVADFSVVEG